MSKERTCLPKYVISLEVGWFMITSLCPILNLEIIIMDYWIIIIMYEIKCYRGLPGDTASNTNTYWFEANSTDVIKQNT